MTAHPTNPRLINGLGHPPNATPALKLDPKIYAHTQDCIQCGLCLPTCPTYILTGDEAESPRGRIRLIKALADGRTSPTSPVINHLDQCLDCRACETACPSNVTYHQLIEQARAQLPTPANRSRTTKLVLALTKTFFTRPPLLRLALIPVRILQRLKLWKPILNSPITRALPPSLQQLLRMAPQKTPALKTKLPPSQTPALNPQNVLLFQGCITSVLFNHVNQQATQLMTHVACNVSIPRRQACCGAIHHHAGDTARAQALARTNIDAFRSAAAPNPTYIVSTTAGCTAMLKSYPHLLRDDPNYAEPAKQFAENVRDACEFLDTLPLPKANPPTQSPTCYHDPCHLAHAQNITQQPRNLLTQIAALDLTPLPEPEMCCGAAGTYNLTHPETAQQLGKRKLDHIAKSGATLCATPNAGCALHLQALADRLSYDITFSHPISLVYHALTSTAPSAPPSADSSP